MPTPNDAIIESHDSLVMRYLDPKDNIIVFTDVIDKMLNHNLGFVYGYLIQNKIIRRILLAYDAMNKPSHGKDELWHHINVALKYIRTGEGRGNGEFDFIALKLLGIAFMRQGHEREGVEYLQQSTEVFESAYNFCSNEYRGIYPFFFFAAQSFAVSSANKNKFLDYVKRCRDILPLCSSEYQNDDTMSRLLDLRNKVNDLAQAFRKTLENEAQHSSTVIVWPGEKVQLAPRGDPKSFEAQLTNNDDRFKYLPPWLIICYFMCQLFATLLESPTIVEGLYTTDACSLSENIMRVLIDSSRTRDGRALTIEVIKYFWYFLLVNPQRWSVEGNFLVDHF